MVARLIRLKLSLMRNSFRRSAWQIVGTVFGLLYGLFMVGLICIAQFVLGSDPQSLETLTVPTAFMGAAVVVIWVLVPLFITGGDSLMDPKQFVTYAVPRQQLITGLILSGLIGVASVLSLVWLVGQVMLWRSEPAALITAVLSIPVLLLMASVLSQATTTAASAWFSGRRVRDAAVIIGMCLLMLLYPIFTGVRSAFETWQEALPEVAAVLGWTPLAAGFLLPADAASGDWAAFALRCGVVVVTGLAAVALIRAGLVKITERPSVPKQGRSSAGAGKLGLLGVVPQRPWAAVAARSLIYWFKDARYGASIIMLPVMVALLVFMSVQSEVPWLLYMLGPLLAWMLGIAISADISYDNTAFALHVTAGVSGMADRVGRMAALMVFGVPVILIGVAVPMTVLGSAQHLVMMLGISLGMFFAFAGFSAFISARMTYPVPKPGDNPFKQPQGAGGRMAIVQFGSLLILLVVMIPEVVLLIVWAVGDMAWLGPVTGLVSIIKGAVLLLIGVRMGARIYDRSQPELFQQVREYV